MNTTTALAAVTVTDTGDTFHEMTWTFRGRTYWACSDGRVRYQEHEGAREVTARAGLDLSSVDWRLSHAAYMAGVHALVLDWLLAHHGGTHAAA